METTIVIILFCILAVMIVTAWLLIDKLYAMYRTIRLLPPWLEMIKGESENIHVSIKKLIGLTISTERTEKVTRNIFASIKELTDLIKTIFELLEQKQKDMDYKHDEAVRKRIEALKNMDTEDFNPLSPKFTYLINEKIREMAKAIEATEDNRTGCGDCEGSPNHNPCI